MNMARGEHPAMFIFRLTLHIEKGAMHLMRPLNLILIGLLLSLLGVALPFLMLMHIFPSTFFLNFFAFTASMTGLILGIIGASMYVREHRK